jgi:hypothetical protein
MTATRTTTRLAKMALIAINAGSMLGSCEEAAKPGGGASHEVGSEMATNDIVRVELLLLVL